MLSGLYCRLAYAAAAYCVAATVSAGPIKEFLFTPKQTYPVHTALGVITQIELDPKDEVKDFGTGLSNGWELVRRENVFYLKPKDMGVDTNLIIRTQARQYVFELKVLHGSWKNLDEVKKQGVHYQIKFRYPEHSDAAEKENKPSAISHAFDPAETYHTDYDFAADTASAWLAPVSVYDNGHFTYIYLGKGKFSGGFPAVYGKKSPDGEEFVVNSTVENHRIVVHGVYPFLVLRHGGDVVGLRRNTR